MQSSRCLHTLRAHMRTRTNRKTMLQRSQEEKNSRGRTAAYRRLETVRLATKLQKHPEWEPTLNLVTLPLARSSTDAPESIIEFLFENCLISSLYFPFWGRRTVTVIGPYDREWSKSRDASTCRRYIRARDCEWSKSRDNARNLLL